LKKRTICLFYIEFTSVGLDYAEPAGTSGFIKVHQNLPPDQKYCIQMFMEGIND
jgi:hypothetical protein